MPTPPEEERTEGIWRDDMGRGLRSVSRFLRLGSRTINLEQVTWIHRSQDIADVFFTSGKSVQLTKDEHERLLEHLDLADRER